MPSILVTGATTRLGRELVTRFLADENVSHVVAVSHESPSSVDDLPQSERFSYHCVDLAKSRQVHDMLFGPARDHKVEIVVHLGHQADPYVRGRRVHMASVEAVRSILSLSDRHPSIRRVILRSYAEVYRVRMDLPVLVTEDHPLNLSSTAPQYVRDRVEADLTACARMGLVKASIVVLRCAEALESNTGSQLYDYLNGRVSPRPAGFDPMINVASVHDLATAIERATQGTEQGVFNIPGYDTLPLSEVIRKWGATSVPLPSLLLRPMFRLQHLTTGSTFEYDLNHHRMHFGLVLDGTRAQQVLGYTPTNAIPWPNP